SGELTLAGSVEYRHQPNVPPAQAVTMNGQMHGHELAIDNADLHMIIHNMSGGFELAKGTLDVRRLEADLLDGRLRATARIENLDAKAKAKLDVSAQEISLNAAKAALKTGFLEHAPIEGQIYGSADAAWTGDVKNLTATSDVTLQGALTGSAVSAHVPIDAAIH